MTTSFINSQTFDWSIVMYQGMALTGTNLQPIPVNRSWNAIYFVIFIIVTNFFITNLFVGVVVSTFNREKESLGNRNKQGFLLTEN